jgi:hypothetical protein
VQWSHDLLDDTEKALLARCSVFGGGFDLAAAYAVGGCGDDLTTLDVLDALVRKSLLVADRSSGRTRFSMLETIRQFAEEQLVASGAATEARTAHARYFAGREADIMSLWDSPRQRDAYDWFTLELANLRAAFRWATDHGDLDVAAPIATSAAWLGFVTDNYEPTAWVEELIEPARANDHPRLTGLYVMASLCYMAGRNDAAIRYTEAAQTAISSGRDHVPYGAEAFLGSVYPAVGQPERWIQSSRAQLARGRDTHSLTATSLVIGLAITGSADAAMEAANGLIDAAEATGNPLALSWALLAYGLAGHDADPVGSLAALRRALAIAQASGNRFIESTTAYTLGGDEAQHGDPLAAFDYFAVAIGNLFDSGNAYMLRAPLGFLATFFDRLGRYEPAATIAGFVVSSPLTALSVMAEFAIANAHLRNVLGEATYESLARKGEAMTTAEIVTYAYAQIDQARTELDAVSK